MNKSKKPINEILKGNGIFYATVSLAKILKHDKSKNSANVFSSKIAPNKLDKDEFSLSEAIKYQEWPLVRDSIQTEINALISRDVFDHLKSQDEIPSGKKIFKLLLLLKQKRYKHSEISKNNA